MATICYLLSTYGNQYKRNYVLSKYDPLYLINAKLHYTITTYYILTAHSSIFLLRPIISLLRTIVLPNCDLLYPSSAHMLDPFGPYNILFTRNIFFAVWQTISNNLLQYVYSFLFSVRWNRLEPHHLQHLLKEPQAAAFGWAWPYFLQGLQTQMWKFALTAKRSKALVQCAQHASAWCP